MEVQLSVSVIIPTYNRKHSLRQTMRSLADQTLEASRYEVVVVDDGSKDGTSEVANEIFPFSVRYFWRENQGDAAARNCGVKQSKADVVVLLDDDMVVEPNYLFYLLKEYETLEEKKIVVGTEFLCSPDRNIPINSSKNHAVTEGAKFVEQVPFVGVFSRNMSIARSAYIELGGMQNFGFSGSSIWCDVDFAYRAYLRGFKFVRSTRAICYHRDYVAESLKASIRRSEETAYRAVVLFQQHPELIPYLDMFQDKTPIDWTQDPLGLTIRKMARSVASSSPILRTMETVYALLVRRSIFSPIVPTLQRWIIGGYIYKGYRDGLLQFGPIYA